ncbi:unnamed protein product, partial [Linum tenue]
DDADEFPVRVQADPRRRLAIVLHDSRTTPSTPPRSCGSESGGTGSRSCSGGTKVGESGTCCRGNRRTSARITIGRW